MKYIYRISPAIFFTRQFKICFCLPFLKKWLTFGQWMAARKFETLYNSLQTFQVSRNYREIHAFLFAFTHHAWRDFLPAFLNLNLTGRGFFLWGNYSHFFSFAQCSMHSFCQRQYPDVLRSLENVCLNRISKRDKKLGDAWGALFFAVWEGGATYKISYSYGMNT
jgi:hypothetical protein